MGEVRFPRHGTKKLDPLIPLISTCLSKAVSTFINAPCYRILELLKTQAELVKNEHLDRPYTGVFNMVKRIYKEQGILSFWRGTFPGLIHAPSSVLVGRALHQQILKFFPVQRSRTDGDMNFLLASIAVASLAGAGISAILYPLEYCRVRLACDVTPKRAKRQFSLLKGLADVFRRTLTTDGVRGLYRGCLLSTAALVTHRALSFGMSDFFKRNTRSQLERAGLAFGTSLFAGMLVYPAEVVRDRMMVSSCELAPYRGAMYAFREIVSREGIAALYRGLGFKICVTVGSALLLPAFDMLFDKD